MKRDYQTIYRQALFVGLGANAIFGWWWADPLTALLLAGLAVYVKDGKKEASGTTRVKKVVAEQCSLFYEYIKIT